MNRFAFTLSLVLAVSLAAASVPALAGTPLVNGASIETRTFNDCPLSLLTVTNSYPASVEITDEMHPACVGFANLHSFSFSDDGGFSAAVFNNDASFRMGADFTITGAGEGEGGLRLSPWWSPYVDGRFMANATTGEIACFGGRLPFYSFTADHGITYTRGETIRMELIYRPNGLSMTEPATIQYRVIMGGMDYESPVLPFDQGNPMEDPPYGLWGMLNDGRAGGYFQPRANTGASLTATWENVEFTPLGTPCADAATVETRTFNDCPLSILTVTNSYPASVEITDEMHPACVGFANLHSFSFSDDGGATAAVFNNASRFRFSADFTIAGAGEGEGGLRLSPWWSPYVDGRFMANATTGEIACFGGRLPFYSFTSDHGITYTRGETIGMELIYEPNGLSMADPATIQYRVSMGGTDYESPELAFDQGNPGEDPPYGLWGMLNNGRAGGYFQPRANTGASLTATWANIEYSSCDCGPDTDPPEISVSLSPDVLWPPNHKYVDVCATVTASDNCDTDPMISFDSATSSEPDNGDGDGDTVDDIVIGDGDCFQLRAERQGRGDGRVYTISYCATDAAGNMTCGAATVDVPHDQSGVAMSSLGFTEDGTALQAGAEYFAMIIPAEAVPDGQVVDPAEVRMGHAGDPVSPSDFAFMDVNGNGLTDLVLYFEAAAANRILEEEVTPALRYRASGGEFYIVEDIFGLGAPLMGSAVGIRPDEQGISVIRAQPNPFRSSTRLAYQVGGDGGPVRIAVFDMSGRLVRRLVDSALPPGRYTAVWDGRSDNGLTVAGGVYFLRADIAGQSTSRRVIRLR